MNTDHARHELTPVADLSALVWHRSFSSQANGNCVECAAAGHGTVLVRDSKLIHETEYPVIAVTETTWNDFIDTLKRDGFAG